MVGFGALRLPDIAHLEIGPFLPPLPRYRNSKDLGTSRERYLCTEGSIPNGTRRLEGHSGKNTKTGDKFCGYFDER